MIVKRFDDDVVYLDWLVGQLARLFKTVSLERVGMEWIVKVHEPKVTNISEELTHLLHELEKDELEPNRYGVSLQIKLNKRKLGAAT